MFPLGCFITHRYSVVCGHNHALLVWTILMEKCHRSSYTCGELGANGLKFLIMWMSMHCNLFQSIKDTGRANSFQVTLKNWALIFSLLQGQIYGDRVLGVQKTSK